MSKHTQGPWNVHRETFGKDGAFLSLVIRGPVKLEENGFTHNPNYICDIQGEANAHLIAAAPELLELLELCYWNAIALDDPRIPAAIKKARGES